MKIIRSTAVQSGDITATIVADDGGFQEHFEKELRFLRSVRHEHVVLFFGAGMSLFGH
jgi:hypothetical protein